MEEVLHEQNAGELAFTALAVGDDGALYATRPLSGDLLALRDTDGDLLPDTAQIIASGLNTPNALVFHAGIVYIAGGSAIYAWDGTLRTLVEGLPAGAGMWNGGIAVVQNRLLVGIGAACDLCTPDPARGVLMSFALDGSDAQTVATGLRQPTLLAVVQDTLWIGDIAPMRASEDIADELNIFHAGAFYGTCSQPNCVSVAPALRFPANSSPYALVEYTGAAFPDLAGQAILLLGGSLADSSPTGFQTVALDGLGTSELLFRSLVPFDTSITAAADGRYDPLSGYVNPSSDYLNRRGAGWYPHQPLGLAISAEGWIYISVAGGRLYVLRPS